MKKKIYALMLCGVMSVSAVGCGTKTDKVENNSNQNVESSVQEVSNVSAKEVVDTIISKNFINMPAQVDDDMAKDMYGLNLENIEEYAIAETQMSASMGLVIVAKAKEGKLEDVKANIEAFRTSRLEGFNYPAQAEAYEKSKVEVAGDIVYYAIFAEEVEAEAMQTIADMLK